jgi:hypothetical protein
MDEMIWSPSLVWTLAGLALCALELATPGVFLIWIGLAALAVGGINLVAQPGTAASLLMFAGLALVFVLIGRKLYGGRSPSSGAVLNDRARSLIGRSATLDAPIGPDPGRIRLDDAPWRVAGPDLPAGARVRVTGVDPDGMTLRVEAA